MTTKAELKKKLYRLIKTELVCDRARMSIGKDYEDCTVAELHQHIRQWEAVHRITRGLMADHLFTPGLAH